MAFILGNGWRTAALPPVQVVSWNVVIDDGFYYLQVARNLARGHGSTFDRVNRTNGYHPLWALALVPVFWFTDDPHVGLRAALVLAAVLAAAGVMLLFLGLQRLSGPGSALLVCTLLTVNPYFLSIMQLGLETPVLFLCLAGLVAFWARRGQRVLAGERRSCLLLGVLLGLTVLARVDVALILLPLGLVLVVWSPGRPVARLRRAALVAGPALVLLVPYALWGLWSQGSALPISGVVKRWVAATYTPTRSLFVSTEQWRGLSRTLHLLVWPRELREPESIGRIVPLLYLPLGAAALLALRVIWSRRARQNRLAQLFGVAGLVGVTGHGLFLFFVYRSCGHWNYHYFFPLALCHTAALALVLPLLLVDLGQVLDRLLGGRLRPRLALLGVLLSLLPAGYLLHRGQEAMGARLRELTRPPAQSFRKSRFDAAAHLRAHYPPEEVFGAWWAGTLGYLSDRRVVNLDGVINSGEFFRQYLRRDGVRRYILEGPIRHLVDFFWRDPLDPAGQPAARCFFWEHDKEHIVHRLLPHLRLAKMIPFQGRGGMYLMDVAKKAD